MTTLEEMLFRLKEYERNMNAMWVYWDDVLRSWKMLERGRIIKELQNEQIKEWNYEST